MDTIAKQSSVGSARPFSQVVAPGVDPSAYPVEIAGTGCPSGGYGFPSGVTMRYHQEDADSADTAMWTSADGGTTWQRLGGIAPERFSLRWLGGSRGKPSLNADIQNAAEATRMIADPDFEILGTNAVSSCSTYDTGGGIALTTTTTTGDQVILVPHLDANQSAWGSVVFPTSKSLIWECQIKTGSAITSAIIYAGLKLTNTNTVATDDDQVFVRYEVAVNSGKFQVISSIAGVDTTTDSGITVVLSTAYHIRICIGSDRTAKVYVNGTLVYTTAALTSTNLIPYIGVHTLTAGARAITARSQAISRLY